MGETKKRRERERKAWGRRHLRHGEKIGSAFGSRLNSITRLFVLFKAHREVIGGRDGNIFSSPFSSLSLLPAWPVGYSIHM